jgi:hypothetical protein
MGTCVTRVPIFGDIENRYIVKPAHLRDRRFGKGSNLYLVMEYDIVEENSNDPIDIGKIIKQQIFPDTPPFVYNASITCSKTNFFTGRSSYADPRSHWFNVFFGFYEFDAPCSMWNRPFGYTSEGTLYITDILKMAKADWNLLGNHVYGVPYQRCLEACKITGNEIITIVNNSILIGDYTYMEVIIENATVITGYPAHESLEKPYPLLTPLVRRVFGVTSYKPGYDDPFPIIRMKGHFYIRYEISHDTDLNQTAYKTFIAGGTLNMDYPDINYNEAFLLAQLEAVRHSLERKPFRKR